METSTLTFEQIKEEGLAKAALAGACSSGLRKAANASSVQELLAAIKGDINWLVSNGVVSADILLASFDHGILTEAGIFINITKTVTEGVYVALGNATVEASGNATVRASGNATVEAWGNATVEALGNATVEASGNATVRAWGNATVRASGNATVEAWDNATVEAWGNAYILSFNSKDHVIADYAIKKDYYTKKIYIKKSSHEIVFVD